MARRHQGDYDFRKTSGYKCVNRVIRIDNQNTLSRKTYQHLETICSNFSKRISKEDFVTMWKFLILERCREVTRFWQGTFQTRDMKYIHVPEPLFDLLNALGEYYSKIRGATYRIELPPTGSESWWNYDRTLLSKWERAMTCLHGTRYKLKLFPSCDDFENRPLILTSKRTNNREIEIRMHTMEPTLADKFICSVNDDLFEDNEYVNFENSFLSNNFTTFLIFQYVHHSTINYGSDSSSD